MGYDRKTVRLFHRSYYISSRMAVVITKAPK